MSIFGDLSELWVPLLLVAFFAFMLVAVFLEAFI